MNVRFYETGLRQVASGLASIARPVPGALDHLVNQMHTLADLAADFGKGGLSGAAQEAQAAAQDLAAARDGARPVCIEALASLGQRLLGDLCAEVEKGEPAAGEQASRRVLVVDDSRVATIALVQAFRARDFGVRAAVTFEEALVELVLFTPHVLVSDVFMPDLQVELLARVFRTLTRGKPSLLVLVSATSGEGLTARLKNINYDVFVSKMEGSGKVVDRVVATFRETAERPAGFEISVP